ncbi:MULTISPECIES: hypothetical protein [unclassified Streptomyces]|uniref:hypothetical protein n=1 Tax=unclassified Streptomyces TaxID=2593676 RepID=UPI00081ECF82|nr:MULTISPECIES: hypothetical protein [unclassified Streptomyces]MYR29868.1 hypothetical protein [Streptomyces sp. SID4945]SCF47927.1 hypothetical protein GA0115257_119421 [Streptomyces sp. LcepLS]
MPTYLITPAENGGGDVLIEDDALVLTLTERWARFSDADGIVLALPVEQIASIQRVDEDEDQQEPAPREE